MTLESGDVFLIRDFSTTGYDPHYQIVVHKTSSANLILVYPTTKIENFMRPDSAGINGFSARCK